MNCPACNHQLEKDDFNLDAYKGSRGPEIDLKFTCPECKGEFYTFVPMSDFQKTN